MMLNKLKTMENGNSPPKIRLDHLLVEMYSSIPAPRAQIKSTQTANATGSNIMDQRKIANFEMSTVSTTQKFSVLMEMGLLGLPLQKDQNQNFHF